MEKLDLKHKSKRLKRPKKKIIEPKPRVALTDNICMNADRTNIGRLNAQNKEVTIEG